MTIIQTTTLQLQSQTRSSQAEQTSNAQFEALLASFDKPSGNGMDSLFTMAQSLLESLLSSLNGNFPLGRNVDFPFTSDFVSTFGTSGPLPEYISEVTKRLNLSTAQQVALQDISVRNKDITRSAESIRKIAAELKAAGIGYPPAATSA